MWVRQAGPPSSSVPMTDPLPEEDPEDFSGESHACLEPAAYVRTHQAPGIPRGVPHGFRVAETEGEQLAPEGSRRRTTSAPVPVNKAQGVGRPIS